MEPTVHRAPMRSRRDDVDHAESVRRALARGLCGIGGRLADAPPSLAAAISAVAQAHDERTAARLERFAAVPDGGFVWTRRADGDYFLGQLIGPWRYDSDPAAYRLDLVQVRPCTWLTDPVSLHRVPSAVLATFARGGRNFQRIHHEQVGAQTLRLWESGAS